VKEAVEEFKKEYQRDMENIRRQEKEKGMFRRKKLPERFTVKKLFGQSDKRYDEEYWGSLEWNWKRWKEEKENKP